MQINSSHFCQNAQIESAFGFCFRFIPKYMYKGNFIYIQKTLKPHMPFFSFSLLLAVCSCSCPAFLNRLKRFSETNTSRANPTVSLGIPGPQCDSRGLHTNNR